MLTDKALAIRSRLLQSTRHRYHIREPIKQTRKNTTQTNCRERMMAWVSEREQKRQQKSADLGIEFRRRNEKTTTQLCIEWKDSTFFVISIWILLRRRNANVHAECQTKHYFIHWDMRIRYGSYSIYLFQYMCRVPTDASCLSLCNSKMNCRLKEELNKINENVCACTRAGDRIFSRHCYLHCGMRELNTQRTRPQ